MRIVNDTDEDFQELHEITQEPKKSFDYNKLADLITTQAKQVEFNKYPPKIIIKFPHNSVSNLVYGLKRRNLIKGVDYKLFRLQKKTEDNQTQVLIQPLVLTEA